MVEAGGRVHGPELGALGKAAKDVDRVADGGRRVSAAWRRVALRLQPLPPHLVRVEHVQVLAGGPREEKRWKEVSGIRHGAPNTPLSPQTRSRQPGHHTRANTARRGGRGLQQPHK